MEELLEEDDNVFGIKHLTTEVSSEEMLHGSKGGDYSTEKIYSSDPDYKSVDSTVFEYLTEDI